MTILPLSTFPASRPEAETSFTLLSNGVRSALTTKYRLRRRYEPGEEAAKKEQLAIALPRSTAKERKRRGQTEKKDRQTGKCERIYLPDTQDTYYHDSAK